METVEKTRKLVRKLYAKHPSLVNDTKKLTLKVLESYGVHLSRQQQAAFLAAPSVESVYRSARMVRSENNYQLADRVAQPVREHRFKLFKFFSGR